MNTIVKQTQNNNMVFANNKKFNALRDFNQNSARFGNEDVSEITSYRDVSINNENLNINTKF